MKKDYAKLLRVGCLSKNETAQKCYVNGVNWLKRNNIVKWLSNPCWLRLSPYFDHKHIECWSKIPFEDHTDLYLAADGRRVLITQPYNLTKDDRNRIHAWCIERGIKERIYPPGKSWHYPGVTSLVELLIEDEEKFKDFVINNKYEDIFGSMWNDRKTMLV